jgi:hypothetical protein
VCPTDVKKSSGFVCRASTGNLDCAQLIEFPLTSFQVYVISQRFVMEAIPNVPMMPRIAVLPYAVLQLPRVM